MSKTLWHTIQIKVPKEMVELTKSGKVSVKKTLTKTLNISRSQKTPAIKLIPSDVNKPHIVNDGKEWNIDALKERMAKARAMRKKNANKNVFDPVVKKMVNLNKFEGNIIKRARELGSMKKTKILKFGDIRGNMPKREMKGIYDLRSYKPAADDIYKHIIEYYWKHAYEFMDPQETPTQDELQTISTLLYQMTKKYYVIRSVASNGNVKGADYFLWDIIDRITDDQYKIIMKIAYHDGKNKNHTLLYKACNIHKKKIEDGEREEYRRREEHKQKRAKMTPEEKQREKEFFNKLSRNELIM
jgi:predicted HicB family RNase H-like nuclease